MVTNLYYWLFRLQLRLRCRLAGYFDRMHVSALPIPPALLRFRVSESLSVREFLRIGEGCANLVEQHVREAGSDLTRSQRVLDFGCGCGRTLRWLLPKYRNVEFHGVDVDRGAIEWCAKNLGDASFVTTNPEQPLPYPSHHFEVIYCFSVFTHLNEDMQDFWLAELGRLLKRDGVLFLTVHGERSAGVLDHAGLAALETEGFVCKSSRKLNGIVPEWYQTTWHSRDYITKRLSVIFQDVQYQVVPDGMQDIVLARARGRP